MEKLITKEIDFVLEPTMPKISKTINKIAKEITLLVGKQYSSIIDERISKTNFVFFNKLSNLAEYCQINQRNLDKLDDRKLLHKYEEILKSINNYNIQVDKLYQKLSIEFIIEIKSELPETDKVYIDEHKKILLNKLKSCNLFFTENKSQLINGLIMSFSNEAEKKLNDKTASINELKNILNNREKCLKILGIKYSTVRTFDKNNLSHIFSIIDKYNDEYMEKVRTINFNEQKIISDFLLNEKMLNDSEYPQISKKFIETLKKDKKLINTINDKILKQIMMIDEPEIVLALDNNKDDNNMIFALFSPTMNFEFNDYLFVREICHLVFNTKTFNTKDINSKNSILGKDKYLMLINLLIDLIAYKITNKIYEHKETIINYKKNDKVKKLVTETFLVTEFYEKYKEAIIQSIINNDINYIYNLVGISNFENFVNIINRYFYDCHGNLLSKRAREKAVFITAIQKILKISLENMEQYQKILINKDKYTTKENIN